MSTYSEATGYGPLNMLSFVGALGLVVGFAVLLFIAFTGVSVTAPRNV